MKMKIKKIEKNISLLQTPCLESLLVSNLCLYAYATELMIIYQKKYIYYESFAINE